MKTKKTGKYANNPFFKDEVNTSKYTDAHKLKVLAKVAALHAAGNSLNKAIEGAGVNKQSYYAWLRDLNISQPTL